MKLDLLTKALQQYLTACDSSEIIDVSNALIECVQTAERYSDSELWKSECCVVPLSTIIDTINAVAYDDFGRLAKPRNGDVPFDVFAAEARKHACLEQMTDAQLENGYGFLLDLWNDNEAYGENNPDGTFRKYYEEEAINCLRRSFDYLNAYQLTNEGCFEPETESNLNKLIDDIQRMLR